jgi:hypothetical protein
MSRSERSPRRWRPSPFIEDEVDEEVLRDVLVAQRHRVRLALDDLEAKAVDLIDCGTCTPVGLAASIEAMGDVLGSHARAEERLLAKLLPGDARATQALARVREHHGAELDQLAALGRLAATGDDGVTLALAVRAFVSDVRLDMSSDLRQSIAG